MNKKLMITAVASISIVSISGRLMLNLWNADTEYHERSFLYIHGIEKDSFDNFEARYKKWRSMSWLHKTIWKFE